MGAADVVPGVSGGTIAFISGIYEELIDSLRNIDWTAVRILFRHGIAAAWRHINGNFLLAIFLGIVTSVLTLAHIVLFCLDNYPVLVWAFFFGLVCASSIYVGRQLGTWRWQEITAALIGFAFAWWIAELKPSQLPGDWWIVLGGGALAICAMILPGVSGSFILLMLGLYTTVIEGLLAFNGLLIGSFLVGCVIGLLAFSHILSWLLHHYHKPTLALLTGFLVGSLNIIWPWKQIVQMGVDRHGEPFPLVQENVWPWRFFDATGSDPHWWLALLLALIGVVLVLGLEQFAEKGQDEKP